MKVLSSAIVLGIGFLMISGSPASAQYGDMGDAVKKGAGDAAKQEIMKGAAEKAGLPAPGAPGADSGAANAPAAAPAAAVGAPGADTGVANPPAGAPQVAPGAANAPAAAAGAAGTAPDADGD